MKRFEFVDKKGKAYGPRLKQLNLLIDVKITYQSSRHETFATFFTKKDGLCYCNNIRGLFA